MKQIDLTTYPNLTKGIFEDVGSANSEVKSFGIPEKKKKQILDS